MLLNFGVFLVLSVLLIMYQVEAVGEDVKAKYSNDLTFNGAIPSITYGINK